MSLGGYLDTLRHNLFLACSIAHSSKAGRCRSLLLRQLSPVAMSEAGPWESRKMTVDLPEPTENTEYVPRTKEDKRKPCWRRSSFACCSITLLVVLVVGEGMVIAILGTKVADHKPCKPCCPNISKYGVCSVYIQRKRNHANSLTDTEYGV